MVRWLLLTVGVAATACSGSAPAATAPPLTAAPTTTTTTPAPTTAAAPSTSAAPSTTLSRLDEIEAIFRDLEFRYLDALYRQDEVAFRALFSNDAYLRESLPILGTLQFVVPPTRDSFVVDIREVLVDRPDCLAALVYEDATSLFGPEATSEDIVVLTPNESGWGLAYAGTSWLCDGPHPLES